jgi:hypothetical protein
MNSRTCLTPQERADLAEHLVPVATELAFLVHTESPDAVQARLDRIDPAHYPALAVVLAAMVDIDKRPEELLSWVTWTWDDWNHAAA